MSDLKISPLLSSDLAEVIAIERDAYPAPWSLAMFVLELSKPGTVCLGARVAGQLAGYCVCSRYDGVWHLMNLAVTPVRQREGIGRALLVNLIGRLEDAAILGGTEPVQLTLEVRRSNQAAQGLYLGHGFMAAGVRRRYYQDNGEDALVLWRTPATLKGRLDDVPNADPAAGRLS